MIWLFHEWLGGHGDMYPAVTTTPLLAQTLIASDGEKTEEGDITELIDEFVAWWNENKGELFKAAHEFVNEFFKSIDELISEYKKEK